MSKPKYGQDYVQRKKEVYFDVFICTGNRYLSRDNYKQVTHYNLFNDLLENSTLEHFYELWRGAMPCEIIDNMEEQQALSTLCLLMFEQELNWRNECWQRYSNFLPSITTPYSRPREMIMSFLKIAFYLGDLDAYPHWKYKNINGTLTATTPTFGTCYYNLESAYKNFFEELANDSSASPLMTGEYLKIFKKQADIAPANKLFNTNN